MTTRDHHCDHSDNSNKSIHYNNGKIFVSVRVAFFCNIYILVDADLKLHDSSEEIACARELLTLGQFNQLHRESVLVSRTNNLKRTPRGVQRVIVSVPKKTVNSTRSHSGLNLDGNITDSSSETSSDQEDDIDSDDSDNTSKSLVSNLCSLSNLILSKNSACPKSTVEDSCCNPPLLNESEQERLSSWSNINKLKTKRTLNYVNNENCPMNGGATPASSPNTSVRPSKVNTPRLSSVTTVGQCESDCAKTIIESEPFGTDKLCDIKTANMSDSVSSASSVTNSSFQVVNSVASPATFITSNVVSQSQGQVMAVPLPQQPVLVFSGANNLTAGATVVTSGGLPTNLVLSSFPGNAMQMAAIPINKGILGVPGPQAINIQSSDVIKVPVALNGGSVVLAPAPAQPALAAGCVVTGLPAAAVQQPHNTVTFASLPPAPVTPVHQQQQQPQNVAPVQTQTVVTPAADTKVEPTYKEDGSLEWRCKVCSKICPTEHELTIHKKRHKIDDPLICPYCQRSYVDQHRYKVHVRTHTGETPFHCELCGKGFRDDRKMKLHMARHNSGLSHKCHLCPRSFEGPKALEKHLKAHEMGRYVAPKVIQRPDGTQAMALPDDPNQSKKVDVPVPVLESKPLIETVKVEPDVVGAGVSSPQPQTVAVMASVPDPNVKLENPAASLAPSLTSQEDEQMKHEDSGQDSSLISLSVDDLYQYSVAQTNVDTAPTSTDNVDIHDKLSEGASKTVPLGLDEFMTGNEFEKSKPLTDDKKPFDDSGDFPDLLDSDHSLATLNQLNNIDYNQYDASDENINQLLKTTNIKEESGLTFATLGGLEPMYNDPVDSNMPSLTPMEQEPVVVAKKSTAPTAAVAIPSAPEVSEEPAVGHPAPVKDTPALASTIVTPVPVPAPAPAPALLDPQNPGSLTFTIQYPSVPVVPAQPETQTDVVPVAQVPLTTQVPPNQPTEDPIGDISQIKPILPPVDPNAKDPTKETFTHITSSGQKIEVPTIITSGYDFDNLLCLFCEKQQFKNDKTLINHLLNHFGVAPKMATCPICGLSLQKKSFARHVRLHGDVKPEVCPYCKKEFREKRSLDKHIRAIHEAERPFPCEHCSELFRNQIELKAHINRHLKDYPYKCDVCSMTFQKQEALTTHYRLHTGEKPFSCPLCDKKFTSEKNKRVHVLRHQGSLPHKCPDCDMTFQSKSHLDKHASSHSRKTQVISAKINTFLESFGASLGEFGLEDMGEAENNISLHSATDTGDIEDSSIRLSVDNLDNDNLEAAAAEAAFAFGGDLPDDFIKLDGTDSMDSSEKSSGFGTPEPPLGGGMTSNAGSAPSLVNGLSEEEAEKLAKAELATEIPATPDGTYMCKYCNTKLGNKRSYIIHLRRHAGMLNFKCKFCTKTFQGRVKLNRHMNTHFRDGAPVGQVGTPQVVGQPLATVQTATTTITPVPAHPSASVMFNCTMCSKIFTNKETLGEHTRQHLIEDVKAKFSSPVSKEKSKSSSSAPSASSLMSPGSSDNKETKYSYTCNLCNQTFYDNEKWRVHKTSHGNKTWKCKLCNLLLESKDLLSSHLMETHNVKNGLYFLLYLCRNAYHYSCLEDAEGRGLLRALPLVVMKAVTQDMPQPVKASKDVDSGDSDDDIPDPVDLMPKHFDKEDAFFSNLSQVSRSNSAASFESENLSTFSDLRPSSACTDASDTSVNASFDTVSQQAPSSADIDESNFDVATLTCKLCKKVLKNMRTFRNHRARHLGTLNHKCPDCSKCFEGRSAVNRHMVSSHNRELQPHEITHNPAAAAASAVNIIKPSAPEIKLFKPSEMAKKSSPTKPSILESLPPILSPSYSSSGPQPGQATPPGGQMPILLENPETEVRYIVGSQLKNPDSVPHGSDVTEEEDEIPEPDPADFDEPLSASSPRKYPEDEPEETDDKDATIDSDKSLNNTSKLPEKLKNFERIIPESDSDSSKSNSDSSSNSSSSSSSDSDDSDSDTDSDFSESKTKKKKKEKLPEEITLEDEEAETKEKAKKINSTEYHNAFESFVSRSKDSTVSDLVEDPLEAKRKTRQTKKQISSPEKSPRVLTRNIRQDEESEDEDEIVKEKAKKKRIVRKKKIQKQEESSSEEDSLTMSESEDEVLPKKSRGKVLSDEEKKQPTKVSMVAAIFRAKKKQQISDSNKSQDAEKKTAKKDLKKTRDSDSESEKEKELKDGNSSDTPLDKETQEEADKLLEQKGVAVVGGKLMIPADRLKIPEELCLIKTAGKGRGTKKTFVCQICEKQFNRADKMKYHLFNEHYDDFIRCSDSVPKILAKNFESTVLKTDKPNTEKEKTTMSKPSALARIFAMKNKAKPPSLPANKETTEKERQPEPEEDPLPPVLEKETYNIPVKNREEPTVKSPRRGRPPKSVERVVSEDIKKPETPVRRSSRSPRGFKYDDDDFNLESTKEKALIAPPSIRLPNIALSSAMLSPIKPSAFGQEAFSKTVESPEMKIPFSSSIVKEEETLSKFEPKFGSNKDLVTFADLALISKEQKQDPIGKPKGRPGRPKKVGRKKISARVSIEQCNIEDTPTLKALEAAKQAEEKELEQESPATPGIDESRPKVETGERYEPVASANINDVKLEEERREEVGKEEEKRQEREDSRSTRSNLHVDRIGIPSSTLDLELHSLRNLIYKEVLEAKPEEINVSVDLSTEDSLQETDAGKGKDDAESEVIKPETPVNVEHEALYFDELPSQEQFIRRGQSFIETSKMFATAIFHERKRLRIKKRKELTALKEKAPLEKKAKFRAKRHEFSLALLCSTNLYNNIFIEAEKTLQNMREVQFLVRNCSNLVPHSKKTFSITKSSDLKVNLKRQRPIKFRSKLRDGKLILTKAIPVGKASKVSSEKAQLPGKFETTLEEPTSIASVFSPSDFKGKGKARKIASPKKFKVNKVTWGQVPQPVEEPKVPKKRGRKPKVKDTEDPEKPKAKRGRKPKVSPEDVQHENQTPATTKRKGRPRKLANIDGTAKTEFAKDEKKSDPLNNIFKPIKDEEGNVKKNIFDFDDNENGDVSDCSTIQQSKTSDTEEVPLKKKKVKRCEFLDGSGDETQVPLKITFKRQSPEGEPGCKRKSIKLRVKTQTTRDNGLKIQIKQPKTDNPLKFKVKAGLNEGKRKRFKIQKVAESKDAVDVENVQTSAAGEASPTLESLGSSSTDTAGKYRRTPFKL